MSEQNSRTSILIIAGVGVLLLAFTIALLIARRGGTPATEPPVPKASSTIPPRPLATSELLNNGGQLPRLRFAPANGEVVSYRFDVSSILKIDILAFMPQELGGGQASPPNQLTTISIASSGVLNLKFFESSAGRWNVAAKITDPAFQIRDVEPGYADNLGYPFLFEIDARGRMGGIRVARGTDDSISEFLHSFILSAEIVFPSLPAAEWSTKETDAMGEYEANYEIVGVSRADSNLLLIEKKKLAYLSTSPQTVGLNQLLRYTKTDITESTALFRTARNGAWIFSMEQDEAFRQTALNRKLTDSQSRWTLKRLESPRYADFPESFEDFAKRLNSEEYILKGLYATDPILNRLAEGKNVSDALSLYFDMLESSSPNATEQAEKFLINYFRLNPEAGTDMIALLDADQGYENYTLEDHLVLWRILAAAGHPQVQQQIIATALNPEYSDGTRIRAMAYVSDFSYPTETLINQLWEMYGNGESDTDIKAMSLLAMGVLGNRDKLNNDVKPIIGERLVEALESAPGLDGKVIALRSIGNYGNSDVLEYVEPYFRTPEGDVREAAFLSLRRMDSPQAQKIWIANYEKEGSPEVRQTALMSLNNMQLREETARWARSAVLQPQTQEEQIALVRILGNSMEQFPHNRNTLRKLLKSDPPRDLKKAIYSYIAR